MPAQEFDRGNLKYLTFSDSLEEFYQIGQYRSSFQTRAGSITLFQSHPRQPDTCPACLACLKVLCIVLLCAVWECQLVVSGFV